MCDRLARCPRSLVLLTSAGVGRTQEPARGVHFEKLNLTAL